ncbi:PAS-domain containing protein [Roseomonas sp. OT10]|uniref:sensor histidine kinase n=1 Tax=Roseomonas cutis TaxID=2897332 RepID=UPI001E54913E|nr:PAS-domain containing protein [Roseomonas sp. OT10]UFN47200.1 PAS-domain containing protein [Roseomonas sp. OT10]
MTPPVPLRSARPPALSGDAALEALAALPTGIAVFDHLGVLRFVNRGLLDILRIEAGALPPGLRSADVSRVLAYRGLYGPGDPEEQARMVTDLDRSRPTARLTRTTDDRWLHISSAPLASGEGRISVVAEVTALRQGELQARARLQDLHRLLDRLSTGIALFGPDDALQLGNTAFGTLIGAPPGSLREGMTLRAIMQELVACGEMPGLSDPAVQDRLGRDRQRPQSVSYERPTGQIYRSRSHPVGDGSWLAEIDDITALRRAEDEARRRASLLDGVLAALPHGVCVYGPDHRVTMVNAAYQAMYADSPAILGEHARDLMMRRAAGGEFGDEDAEEVIECLLGDRPPRDGAEHMRLRPNGLALGLQAGPLPDGGRVVVATDMTARHAAEQEVRRQAEIRQVMLETTRHGVALFDAGARLVAANTLAARMTGLSPEEMRPGMHLLDLHEVQVRKGEFGPPETGQGERIRQLGHPIGQAGRYVRERPDGTILEITTAITQDGGFVRTYTDITEERRVQAELERAREAAEAGSRAKSRFLAGMSHELRTPLNAVIGFAEVLLHEKRGRVDREQERDFARTILDSGRHLLGLIDDILDVARAESGGLAVQRRAVALLPVLEGAARMLQGMAEEAEVTIAWSRPAAPEDAPPERPVTVQADELRLRQVVLNLLANAVKFTPAGGRVELSARPLPDGGLEVRVADTGIGMAPEDIPRAFEPFTQLDQDHNRRYGGSGLGLHLSRVLAEAMGLSLGLDSAPGRGTTARLAFPPELLDTASP